jgi:O-antigen/teichoic acid export membrane protein
LDEVGLAYGAMIAIFFSFCSRYFSLILRMEERGLAFSISQILPKLIFLGCLLIIYLNGIPTTFWMLLGIHISGAAIAMLFFALNTRHVWFDTTVIEKTETVKLNNLMAYGFPLMLAGLAFWVVEAIDKVMLRYLSNFSDLGVYSVTVGIASIAGMLSIIFTTVWMPTVYSWGENVNSAERIEGVAKKLVILGSLLICISGVFSWILKYILPDEYILAQYLIPLCMVPSVLYAAAEVTGSGLGITRRNRPLVFITLATCLINIIFNWLFIPVLGATGAAIATAIAYFSFFILRTEVSMHNFKTMQRRPLYIPTGLVIILAILFSLVGSFNPIIGIVVWVIATFSFLFVARNIFLMMLSNLKKIKF